LDGLLLELRWSWFVIDFQKYLFATATSKLGLVNFSRLTSQSVVVDVLGYGPGILSQILFHLEVLGD